MVRWAALCLTATLNAMEALLLLLLLFMPLAIARGKQRRRTSWSKIRRQRRIGRAPRARALMARERCERSARAKTRPAVISGAISRACRASLISVGPETLLR